MSFPFVSRPVGRPRTLSLSPAIAAAIGSVLSFSGCAVAGVVNTTGAASVVGVPTDVTVGAFESNTKLAVFTERQLLTLNQPLAVDITAPSTVPQDPNVNLSLGTIPADTLINSYYVHFDPVGTPRSVLLSGSITVGEQILGLIVGVKDGLNTGDAGNTLDLSNAILGVPGTAYGFEPLDFYNFTDSLTLSADRRTVTMDWSTGPSADNMRIITAAAPEPSALAIAAALLPLAGRRRRR